MSILISFTPVIAARKEVFKKAETGGTGENNKNSENRDKDKNSKTNLIRVLCI